MAMCDNLQRILGQMRKKLQTEYGSLPGRSKKRHAYSKKAESRFLTAIPRHQRAGFPSFLRAGGMTSKN